MSLPPAARRLPVGAVTAGALGLLALAVLLGVLLGESRLSAGEVARAFLHGPGGGDPAGAIVWELRLPRVLLAALVGAALAMAGAALQGLTGNPLADPYLAGVSSGASVGAGVAILLGWAGALGGLALPALAFAGALAATAFVFAFARAGGKLHLTGFLLAGIVVGTFLSALMNLLLSLAGQEQSRVLAWLLGYFGDAEWRAIALLAPVTLIGAAVLSACGRGLDAFTFGEETAFSLGVETERFKIGILSLSALLTASAVAFSGVIGFVGLVVPHLVRSLIGPPHRPLIPVAALTGGALTVLADLLARTLRPEGLPIGVVTALLGAPFFVVLLRRQMGR